MLEENVELLCQLVIEKDFLNWIHKVETIKEKNNELDFLNIRDTCLSKDPAEE